MAAHGGLARAARDAGIVSDGYRDPRFLHALALLQDCLHRPLAGPGPDPCSPLPENDWLVSSTDILTPWYPETAPGNPADLTLPGSAWDAYFSGFTPSFRGDGHRFDPRAAAPDAEPLPFDVNDLPPSAPLASPSPAVDSDQAADEAVIETLYGFLHAIGRADVPAAMGFVAADYHAMDGDREITHDVLRQQIEDLVDARRDRGLDVSLAQVPEPIASPYGVLVKLTIAIDAHDGAGVPQSLLLHRVAVFRQDRDERWMLAALAVVHPVP